MAEQVRLGEAAGADAYLVKDFALPELERRERLRGDRRIGEARADFEVTHTFGRYDHECSSVEPGDGVVARIIEAWMARVAPIHTARETPARLDPGSALHRETRDLLHRRSHGR